MRRRNTRHRLVSASGLVALLAPALWLRVSNHGQVFAEGSVFPLTADATFHLHRSLETFRTFPQAKVFDPLMNWPEGANAHVADGYDVLSAALAKLALSADEVRAAAVMVYVPIGFGFVTALFATLIASAVAEGTTGRARASWAALAVSLFAPVGIYISLLGRTDHHCAEAACIAALCYWTLARFPLATFADAPVRAKLRFELAGALAIVAAMYLFNGSLLYVALVAVVPLMATLFSSSVKPAWLGSGALALLLGALATAGLYGLALRQHGVLFSYAFPSLLQPAGLFGLAVVCASGVVASHRVTFDASTRVPWPRLAWLGGVSLTGLLALGLVPAIRQAAIAGLTEQLFGRDPWMQTVVEAQPLIAASEVLTRAGWTTALQYFGLLAPLSCLLLPLGVLHAVRVQPGRTLAFAWLACTVLALTLVQSRFARPLVPLCAAWTGLGVSAITERVRRWLADRGASTTGRFAGLAHGLVYAALGLVLLTTSGVERRWRLRDAGALDAPQRASLFLSRHNPPRANGSRPGVLAPWSWGHTMMWPAKTGVVANGFLFHIGRETLERSDAALTGTEANALAWMDERDLRWLVIGAQHYDTVGIAGRRALVASPRGPLVNAEYVARAPLAASMLGGGGFPEVSVAHLEGLCPRWAAPLPGTRAGATSLPPLWVFERVAGARLTGQTAPGTRVVARAELFARGVPLPYAAWAQAGTTGQFAIRVPIWNGELGDGVRSGAHYRLELASGEVAVEVRERDVREGRDVAVVPDTQPELPLASAPEAREKER